MKAVAFIDNGSDTILITKRFAVKNGIATRPSSTTIRTVNGTKAISADQTSVKLVSLDSGERVEVTEASTIADLLKLATESIGEPGTHWPQPRDLCFEEANSHKVDLLIGCDVPEAQ
ncbi:unnamed protein product [Echinostoma caproni]|uniref:DUF1758 domain-containing protein n=1 Tax=Echinostoma caproni TaxID=27848 RepID=A0A183BD66_9TREM|nr:unnamed protein product [Echinostoma caproni]